MFQQNLVLDDDVMLESFSCEMYLNKLRTESHVFFKNHDVKIANNGLSLAKGQFHVQAQDFIFNQILGKGQCGVVQHATYKPNSMQVAIKTVNIHSKEKRRQLMNDLLIFLKHGYESKHLIIFYGAFFHELILELMDMGSLRDILLLLQKIKMTTIGQGPLISEGILSQITFQILSGIYYLHNYCNQVHRDIKLENILINSQGYVKLADFVFVILREFPKNLKKIIQSATLLQEL